MGKQEGAGGHGMYRHCGVGGQLSLVWYKLPARSREAGLGLLVASRRFGAGEEVGGVGLDDRQPRSKLESRLLLWRFRVIESRLFITKA